MNKKNCREALDMYKKFLDKTDNVSAFLKVAEVKHLNFKAGIFLSVENGNIFFYF